MKPQIVTDWERSVETIEQMAPKCCYTCCEFNGSVTCNKHGLVPATFIDEVESCGDWNREPF